MSTFPCISLHQPFASALFLRNLAGARLKVHETRTWPAPTRVIGQRVAIHAAKKPMPVLPRVLINELEQALGEGWRVLLPKGAVIGTVLLSDSRMMGDGRGTYFSGPNPVMPDNFSDGQFGFWEDGRFAWRTDDEQALATPIPAIGRQGWFTVEIPG